jgi:hypothetical protein
MEKPLRSAGQRAPHRYPSPASAVPRSPFSGCSHDVCAPPDATSGVPGTALPFASLLARPTRCVKAPRPRKKGSHRGHGEGLTGSTEKRMRESGDGLRETGYWTWGSRCRLVTRRSSLHFPCPGFAPVPRIPSPVPRFFRHSLLTTGH